MRDGGGRALEATSSPFSPAVTGTDNVGASVRKHLGWHLWVWAVQLGACSPRAATSPPVHPAWAPAVTSVVFSSSENPKC